MPSLVSRDFPIFFLGAASDAAQGINSMNVIKETAGESGQVSSTFEEQKFVCFPNNSRCKVNLAPNVA